ncbi:S1 RNA-binding domain-containing protein [Streptomyces sp. NPDC058434]|uniref:S1 RNA-binding domain-containing protein n=1 Tax=Streptomyces sp. NPDC058434 TaxID=3346498 RepID=UPI0036544687
MIEPPENAELREFLGSLHHGDLLTGTVAAVEPFGVSVALDDGLDHPLFPGVGFITFPELSRRSFEDIAEIVQIGQRVSCVFLQFDPWNGEARLSLRATQSDPIQAFAEGVVVGQRLSGRVSKLLPFGVVAEVADGVEGVVHRRELAGAPTHAPGDGVSLGDDITVVVTGPDRQRRAVSLSQRQALPCLR